MSGAWAQESEDAPVNILPTQENTEGVTGGANEGEGVTEELEEAETPPVEIEKEEEEELPLEEALALINETSPLPSFDEEPEPEPVSALLPLGDVEPDYALLRSLQLEDKIREVETRINGRGFGVGPVELEEYFATRESWFLRDPERYLTSQEKRQLQEILIQHAGESPYNLHLNMFGTTDVDHVYKLTEEQNEKVLANDKKGILVYFFYDDPSRVAVYYGKKVRQRIPEEIRNELMASAKLEATLQPDPFQSLYRYILDFTLQLSNYTDARGEELEATAGALATDFSAEEKEVSVKKSDEMKEKILGALSRIGKVPLVVLSGVFLLGLCVLSYIFYYKKKMVHRFPITEVPSNLDFPRARGCSGTLEFGPSSPPLESQKKSLHP